MITFIKNYELDTIKKKFMLLYVLNVTDIMFTLLLLQTGFFAEANVLMVKAVSSPLLSLFIKVFIPAILLLYIYHRIKAANPNQLKAANVAVNISLSMYAFVNITHIVWLSMLPYLMAKY